MNCECKLNINQSEARGICGHQAGIVDKVEEWRFEVLANGQGALDDDERYFWEDDSALGNWLQFDFAAIELLIEICEEIRFGIGQQFANVIQVWFGEAKVLHVMETIFEARKHCEFTLNLFIQFFIS